MSTPEPRTTALEDRVPWTQLIAYGMGGVVPIALFNIAGHLMGLLGNISLGLSAFWLGTIMIIPRLWDAFSDPIVGHLSDNTRTRWGRRRPYILIGGIAVALSFVAMWWIPRGDWIRALFPGEDAYNALQLVYILFGLLVFFTAITIFEIPHGALGIEMSSDYHERTRLFSAKSFMGNVFAMGTPWLLWLATREFFSGPGGNEADGMRYVSLFIAAGLIPMSIWWFVTLKEPGFAIAKQQQKTRFWSEIRTTMSNRTFLSLVAIIFTLAMGFDFVALFNYYITIFYLYGGDTEAASALLGINGTIWAVTGIVAVFPLNWLSRRLGKNRTLLVAILLMCAAQLSKIFAYNPELPYLVIIPTVLLSSGMLMFFTLGSSMLGDICDEDELQTGTRNEGSYCSVYWWFIATGKAFASFVTGALLLFTAFDERQKVLVDAVSGNVAAIKADAERLSGNDGNATIASENIAANMSSFVENSERLRGHLAQRLEGSSHHADHIGRLLERADAIRSEAEGLQNRSASLIAAPQTLAREADGLLEQMTQVRKQAPATLFRLRLFEIGVPLALSIVSIMLTLRYPLTEARCYEIKEALQARHATQAV
jgi:GPH family glycoside/pentoside/hexuronide:cation symporter